MECAEYKNMTAFSERIPPTQTTFFRGDSGEKNIYTDLSHSHANTWGLTYIYLQGICIPTPFYVHIRYINIAFR